MFDLAQHLYSLKQKLRDSKCHQKREFLRRDFRIDFYFLTNNDYLFLGVFCLYFIDVIFLSGNAEGCCVVPQYLAG